MKLSQTSSNLYNKESSWDTEVRGVTNSKASLTTSLINLIDDVFAGYAFEESVKVRTAFGGGGGGGAAAAAAAAAETEAFRVGIMFFSEIYPVEFTFPSLLESSVQSYFRGYATNNNPSSPYSYNDSSSSCERRDASWDACTRAFSRN